MPRNPDKIDYSQGFPAGFRSFEMIKDPRSGGHTLHHFGEILFVGDKSNVITAIPELLEMLNLQGAVVTIDAMGTQREIATKIVEKGGDCILCVKGNQGSLHKEISDHFEFAARQLGKEKLDPANWSHAETLARSHGRNERRQTIACRYLVTSNGWLPTSAAPGPAWKPSSWSAATAITAGRKAMWKPTTTSPASSTKRPPNSKPTSATTGPLRTAATGFWTPDPRQMLPCEN